MVIRRLLYGELLVLAASLCGCAKPPAAPPASLAEYQHQMNSDPDAYSRQVVVLYNTQRVLDHEVSPAHRLASLKLLSSLGAVDGDLCRQLAGVLNEAGLAAELRRGILVVLLEKDYPGLSGPAASALGQAGVDDELQRTLLGWIERHPYPEVLADVIAAWARQSSSNGAYETRYRQMVEKISGRHWIDALIESMNRPGFAHPVAAYDILARRLDRWELRRRLGDVKPATEPVGAIQTFLTAFSYLPPNDDALESLLLSYRKHGQASIMSAAQLAGQWKIDCGYVFDIRDLPLLMGLAGDPQRRAISRIELQQNVSQQIDGRRHIAWQGIGGVASDRFKVHAATLGMSDLWNLYLLSDMLGRTRSQVFVGVMATGDRGDRAGAWGGLISYRAGAAEARRYPNDPRSAAGDLLYVPADESKGGFDFQEDRRDALCRFFCHVERPDNAQRAGPTAGELADARRENYCGLVLTTISATEFAAHYFNPAGNVVSLGVFPIKQ